MKFLIDNALSPVLAHRLRQEGYDAVHVRDLGLASAPDPVIFDVATTEERVIVPADTDFGTLLALRSSLKPSVILFRREDHRPLGQLAVLLANLSAIRSDLEQGAIVVFEDARVRIRRLPIGRENPGAAYPLTKS